MKVELTIGEARSIAESCKMMIECESDAIHNFPESSDVFKQEVKNWKAIKRKLRAAIAKSGAKNE